MEPGGSLPHSQEPATCPYPEPAQSSPCPNPTLFKSWPMAIPKRPKMIDVILHYSHNYLQKKTPFLFLSPRIFVNRKIPWKLKWNLDPTRSVKYNREFDSIIIFYLLGVVRQHCCYSLQKPLCWKNEYDLYGTNFLYLVVFTEVCLVRKRIAPVGEMFERALCYSTVFNLTNSIEQSFLRIWQLFNKSRVLSLFSETEVSLLYIKCLIFIYYLNKTMLVHIESV
jgi:hypothetical protein